MAEAPLIARVSTVGAAKAERELKGLSKQAKETETNVVKMGDKFKSVGKNASAAVASINGPLGGISSRITSVTTVLTSGTAAASAFGVAIAAAGFALANGVVKLDEYEVNLRRVEAVLKATGFAAGFSAMELQNQARELARATLTSTEEVQKAQAALSSFNRVSGETFTRAIELAQDLAESGFGSLTANAQGLGKALQDPIQGMTLLSRQGSLTKSQQQDIGDEFKRTGNLAKAQGSILDALASQYKGVGSAVAVGTLAGAMDTLGISFDEASISFAKSTGLLDFFIKTANNASFLLDEITLKAKNAEFVDRKKLERDVITIESSLQSLKEKQAALTDESSGYERLALAKGIESTQAALDAKTALSNEANKKYTDGLIARNESERAIAEASAATKKALIEQSTEVERAAAQQGLTDKLAYNEQSLFLSEERLIRENQEFNDSLTSHAAYLAQRSANERQAADDDLEFYETVQRLKADSDEKLAKDRESVGKDSVSNLKTVLGEQSGLYKAAAISEAAINTYRAANAAYAAMAGIPVIGPALGIAAAGLAISAGLANVGQIAAREQGGMLSAGQTSTIAERGEVEVITPANASRVRTASQMRSIMGGDSGGSTNVSLVVIDQSTGGKDFSTEQNDDGRIILLIRNTVSSDLQTSNTDISKSLTSSFRVQKNNG